MWSHTLREERSRRNFIFLRYKHPYQKHTQECLYRRNMKLQEAQEDCIIRSAIVGRRHQKHRSWGEKRCVGKPEGKKPLGRPKRRWGYNIRMNRREIGFGCGLDSSGLG